MNAQTPFGLRLAVAASLSFLFSACNILEPRQDPAELHRQQELAREREQRRFYEEQHRKVSRNQEDFLGRAKRAKEFGGSAKLAFEGDMDQVSRHENAIDGLFPHIPDRRTKDLLAVAISTTEAPRGPARQPLGLQQRSGHPGSLRFADCLNNCSRGSTL